MERKGYVAGTEDIRAYLLGWLAGTRLQRINMSKSQRTKGAGGEREWCRELARYGFYNPKRLLGQSRDGGGDVLTPPFLWEVKRRHKIAAYKFTTQATEAAGEYVDRKLPAVAMRADDEEWLVVMRASDLLPLLKAYCVESPTEGNR